MIPNYNKHTGKREASIVLMVVEILLIWSWVDGNKLAADAAQYFGPYCAFPFFFYAFGLDWTGKDGGNFLVNIVNAMKGKKEQGDGS